jgi:hypothetical protein
MKITAYSRQRFIESANYWEVPREYFDPLYNYLVHGFAPGGFWRAALANDFISAMQHSHPSNSIPSLKMTAGWIQDQFPAITWGNYKNVDDWCFKTSPEQRRPHLEAVGLIYTEKQEIMLSLHGAELKPEPHLW